MIYGEILAGGSGTRMGNTQMPKQFLTLGDKPIIVHTLEQFIINPKFNKLIVVCPKEWISYFNNILNKYELDKERIDVVAGGANRNESVINGCIHIKETYGITDKDIIVTHDAVRPFVTQRILDDNIKAAKKYGACDTIIPAVDTIVMSEDGKTLSNIPVRNECYQGQTPQSFKIKELMDTFDSLTAKEKNILTDSCKIYTIKNKPVAIVMGELYNIKITTLYDFKIANAILMGEDEK